MSEKKRRPSDVIGEFLAAFLITYALAVFSYEKYMPESFMKAFNVLVFIAFAVTWLGLSFKNGSKKAVAFPVFTALYWLIPQLVIYLADSGPEVFRMSITMYILSEFSILITTVPSELIGGTIHISVPAAIAVILLLSAAAYMAGMLVNVRKKGNYT